MAGRKLGQLIQRIRAEAGCVQYFLAQLPRKKARLRPGWVGLIFYCRIGVLWGKAHESPDGSRKLISNLQ